MVVKVLVERQVVMKLAEEVVEQILQVQTELQVVVVMVEMVKILVLVFQVLQIVEYMEEAVALVQVLEQQVLVDQVVAVVLLGSQSPRRMIRSRSCRKSTHCTMTRRPRRRWHVGAARALLHESFCRGRRCVASASL